MSGRYEKLDLLLAFQQKSHYDHIIHPRATIKIEPPTRRSLSLHYKTKTTHQKDRLRKLQNKKMLCNLLEIYNGQGLLSKIEQSNKKINEKKNKVLTRSFNKIEEQKGIRKQNKDLLVNIQNAEPMIGNKKDWDKHFEKHLEMEKKLCGYSVRNRTSNLTNFKTFYNKKRRLISQEKMSSERNSEQKQKQGQQIIDILAKRQRRKRKLRNKKGKLQLTNKDQKQQCDQSQK